jgi:hypothetical protein
LLGLHREMSMPPAAFEFCSPAPDFDRLPIALEQRFSRLGTTARLLLLVPALLSLIIPLALVAARAAETPATLSVLADKPLAAIELAFALALWTILFVVPIKGLIGQFACARSVRINAGCVAVTEHTLFGTRTWKADLLEYSGVAHHVRTSLSGTRRELILVHPVRRKSVLLHAADQISESMARDVAMLLGLKEISGNELYRIGAALRSRQSPSDRAPKLASQAA